VIATYVALRVSREFSDKFFSRFANFFEMAIGVLVRVAQRRYTKPFTDASIIKQTHSS